ncbi:hypothetical protein, variant [Aphanomyces invadans]|uniref:UDENN domain-containing protein n=1 Tax=Aphanomyces invadans TaxID=157072 RepID=A0A024TPD9_9STRA|nr:hypothetical protein, variant [Aphanomyces invadans]ETV95481.1 hypothetical protein, variant [Aphanomyces invadans]|eukprot:XP_008875674.1 hypothetical protein, variant [Aphanomyces invadans]
MSFLKKPDNFALESWLFGEDIDTKRPSALQVRSAPTSRPHSPSLGSNGSGPVLMFNPKLVAAATDAANKIQDTYKKMSTKALNSQYPMPISKHFRKYLKAKQQHSLAKTVEEDELFLSPSSYTRLRSYTPASLPEITMEGKTNYHQVLLFLLELEQQKAVGALPPLLKLFNKYFTRASEFCISETLELTNELEQLVLANIQQPDIGWLGFRPLQKLAFKRLAREELPRFIKSDAYLKMLKEVEQTAAFVPMERFLTHRRAAHYFLLFLMQQRQHFELYFWLHVEYVLLPCSSSQPSLFWSLTADLVAKAAVDSTAILDGTKATLTTAVASSSRQSPDAITTALAALKNAQKDIVRLLSASWYDRFVKSRLYVLALHDRKSKKVLDSDSEDEAAAPSYSEYDTDVSIPTSSLVHHEEESEDDSDDDASDEIGDEDDGSSNDSNSCRRRRMLRSDRLDLESILRSTNLPPGLQVHYRPNYVVSANTLSDYLTGASTSNGVDSIVLFKTSLERSSGLEVSYVRRDKTAVTTPEAQRKIQDLAKRIQPFLVPHGFLTSAKEASHATMLPFLVLQNGHDDHLYGVSYFTSCNLPPPKGVATVSDESPSPSSPSEENRYGIHGICLLSTYPLLETLRKLMIQHVRRHPGDACVVPDNARELYEAPTPSTPTTHQGSPGTPLVFTSPPTPQRPRLMTGMSFLDLPPPARLDFSLDELFHRLSSALVLEVVANALLEHSVIFVSNSYTSLTMCAESVRSLLHPFTWCHIYIPLLPKSLLSYLHCPTPIMVGVHQSTTSRDDLPVPSDASATIVVDLDRGTIEYLGTRRVEWGSMGLQDSCPSKHHIRIVDAFHDAKCRLDALLSWRLCVDAVDDQVIPDMQDTGNLDQQRRSIFHDLVYSLLDHHNTASLVVGDAHDSVIMFDEMKFTALRPAHEAPFIESLVRTQSFSEIISTHRIGTSCEA